MSENEFAFDETLKSPPAGRRKKPRTCSHCKRHFRRFEHLQRHLRIRMFNHVAMITGWRLRVQPTNRYK